MAMSGDAAGRYAFDGLDRAIHEKARLGIMTSLAGHPKGLAFSDLKRLCDLTDGNLNRHLQVLQDAEFVTVTKSVEKNRPLTICKLTPSGRRRFVDYLDVLEALVRDAREETMATLSPRMSKA
jgi:DNA-binding MarR family transcriptional regulator